MKILRVPLYAPCERTWSGDLMIITTVSTRCERSEVTEDGESIRSYHHMIAPGGYERMKISVGVAVLPQPGDETLLRTLILQAAAQIIRRTGLLLWSNKNDGRFCNFFRWLDIKLELGIPGHVREHIRLRSVMITPRHQRTR